MRVSSRFAELAVLVVLVAANLLQTLVVPQRWQLLTGPAFAATAVAVAVASGLTWSALGLSRDALRSGFRLGAGAVMLVGVAVGFACAVPSLRERFVDPVVGADSLGHVLFEVLLRIPIATAGPEEVLFRGVVLAMAIRRLGYSRGTVVAAFLFGLWHVAPTLNDADFSSALVAIGAAVGIVVATSLAAIVFTWLRRRSGSVLAPFLAHWGTNGIGLLAVYLVSR